MEQETFNTKCKDCNISLQDCTCIEDTINMKKTSSIEWFAEVVAKMGYVSTDILEQAIAMHRQEIVDAINLPIEKRWYNALLYNNSGEQYYNKTYGK